MYRKALEGLGDRLEAPSGGLVLDIGCGTGALAYCLVERGYRVAGVDAAPAMAAYAAGLNRPEYTSFVIADASRQLPFRAASFDCVTASFVLHGLRKRQRESLMREAARLSRHQVIFHDFDERRFFITDLVERLEGGDYFNFINSGRDEMDTVYSSVHTIPSGPQTSWYICTRG
jgi:ubiquinone/menaquinone biosynthesis C-methylase UbiE